MAKGVEEGKRTHIWHSIGATGGQNTPHQEAANTFGLTAADTFSHESEFGRALFFFSSPPLYPVRIIELTELRGGHLQGGYNVDL